MGRNKIIHHNKRIKYLVNKWNNKGFKPTLIAKKYYHNIELDWILIKDSNIFISEVDFWNGYHTRNYIHEINHLGY